MVEEARMEENGNVRTPVSDGWFVLHASEAPWRSNPRFGRVCDFEGDTSFGQIGIHVHILQPGQPACLYHREEDAQEDFFVLEGECLVLIEGQERQLRAGHFVHCPPGTDHVFVGAGDGPCAILMVGHRPAEHIVYPVSELAARYGASVEEETTVPREAYGQSPVFADPAEPFWPW